MDDYKSNPNWKRPKDWKYEEDWDSPAWRDRMRKREAEWAVERKKFGFSKCPECGERHTALTMTCRGCGHRAKKDS